VGLTGLSSAVAVLPRVRRPSSATRAESRYSSSRVIRPSLTLHNDAGWHRERAGGGRDFENVLLEEAAWDRNPSMNAVAAASKSAGHPAQHAQVLLDRLFLQIVAMPDACVGRVNRLHRFDVAAFDRAEKTFGEIERVVCHGTRR
jgi:hypothetical protein